MWFKRRPHKRYDDPELDAYAEELGEGTAVAQGSATRNVQNRWRHHSRWGAVTRYPHLLDRGCRSGLDALHGSRPPTLDVSDSDLC